MSMRLNRKREVRAASDRCAQLKNNKESGGGGGGVIAGDASGMQTRVDRLTDVLRVLSCLVLSSPVYLGVKIKRSNRP
jgi:hypothetical protein